MAPASDHGLGNGVAGWATAAGYPGRMKVEKGRRTMRIAIVCPRFPLPMVRADQVSIGHLLAFLYDRGHDVDLYSLYEGIPPSDEQYEWVVDRCREVTVLAQPRWRKVAGAGTALLRGLPLQVGWFENLRLERRFRQSCCERRYDVIYAYTLRSAELARGLGRSAGGREGTRDERPPVTYLAMQVSQSLNTRRIAQQTRRWHERLIYRLEHRLITAYEARIWRDFTRTVLIGKADLREIQRVCFSRNEAGIDNYLLAPHGVDTDRFRPRVNGAIESCGIVFSGMMAANTNVSAVLWFVESVWPKVRAACPQATFTIVGRQPRREILALGKQPGITVTGEVPDPADYIGRATLCVNPMQAGAGMQNKLLEYMAMAKAVVATPVANEGIGALCDREILIAHDPVGFSAAVVSLLRDPDRRKRLGEAARARVTRDWSWETHFLRLEADMMEQSRRCT